VLPEHDPPRRVLPPKVTDELRELLVGVTTKGTARRAFLASDGQPRLGALRVAGKTGTLHGNDPSGLYQWFIGVAPADGPRVAIATVVLDGASGHGASLVAAEVLQQIFCDGERCTTDGIDARLAARAALQSERSAGELRSAHADAPPEPVVAIAAAPSELDAIPRLIGAHALELPRRLLESPASGRIVLLLDLGPAGEVKDVRVDSSDLPEFEDVVVSAVRAWRFTPPTRRGEPVAAQARLPIPIRVK
jgi:TonB family protein